MKNLLKKVSLLLSILYACCCSEASGQYAADSIPANLLRHAHTVLRYSHTEVNINTPEKVDFKRKYAITVLDEQGKNDARLVEHYNDLIKINKIKGWLYDRNGKEIRTLKEKDIYDRSTYGLSFAFHSDSRMKIYDFNQNTYPYTVVFEIDETFKTSFFLPSWEVQPRASCAVESSDFVVKTAADVPVRFKEYLMPAGAFQESNDDKGNRVRTWSLRNIAAYEEQPRAQAGNYEGPTVLLAAEGFELEGYKGNMKSWEALGTFMHQLNENRDILPEDKKTLVKSLTDGLTDTIEKIQKLYTYMQQNTRYVANEYGLAGWQTFDAENVAKNGYGDCKGLTNYLKAMLKEAGINAYPALVYAGENYHKLDESFPCNTFNHVILCVPLEHDSVWVECTSQQLPAGYLGSFTQGRKVLLITEKGGYVCNTPSYRKDKSYVRHNAVLTLNSANSRQTVTLSNLYSGLMQDDLLHFLKTQPEDKIREMVNVKFSFPSYSVSSYNYGYGGSRFLPEISEHVEAQVSGIISTTQKRTFVNVGWMKNPMTEIFQTIPRTLPFILDRSFAVTDSITVILPAGAEVETMPRPVSVKYPFATYSTRFERSGDRISMIRTYEQNEGTYDTGDFEKYQQLYKIVNSEKENMSIVLLNKAS